MTTTPVTSPAPDRTGSIDVRFFAAARAAAGASQASFAVTPSATVADVLDVAVERFPGLAAVLPRCSFLLDQVAVHGRDTRLGSASTLDVLPPFAGG